MSERTIYLFDGIHKSSVKTIIETIMKANQYDDDRDKREKDFKRTPIDLIINSNGGNVYDGLALIDAIDGSRTPVHTHVYGFAASMGLLIAVSGHHRCAGRLSTFMYHSVSNQVAGYLEHLKNRLDEVQRLQALYDQYLMAKTNVRQEELTLVQERQRDWFITPEEAIKLNIIDEII